MTKIINIKGPIISDGDKWIYNWLGKTSTCPKDVNSILEMAAGEDVCVEINSPGGFVDMGSEIYTSLRDYTGSVVVKIVGMAASAASLVACAADRVLISPVARMMIHNAKTSVSGDYQDMESAKNAAIAANQALLNGYESKTGMNREKLQSLMDNETHFDAKKAVELGFADEIMFSEEKGADLIASFGDELISPEIVSAMHEKRKNGELLASQHMEKTFANTELESMIENAVTKVIEKQNIIKDKEPKASETSPFEAFLF